MVAIPRLGLANFAAAILMLSACEYRPERLKSPNMTPLTPRLHRMFEKTKTVCFGRFIVDVPASSRVVWGDTNVPYEVKVYPDGVDDVKAMGQNFIDELQSEKAINHDDVPLLLAVNDVSQPEGKIVIGYEDYQAINGLKINGYFKLDGDGVVINARPLSDEKDETISDLMSMAQRLRQRTETEVPAEPGNCIEYAFLKDKLNPSEDDLLEHVRISFRLNEFPDAHLSIYVAPSNPHNPEGDSLEAQWKRMVDEATPQEKKALDRTRFFRKSPRQIRGWQTGFEVLARAPDEEASHSHHDFQVRFIGVPNDSLKPYADVQFQTGVDHNSAGATKASLTDKEAIAVWDKITSTIRVRPTNAAPVSTSEAGPRPHLLLGELAATGRTCPQTGW